MPSVATSVEAELLQAEHRAGSTARLSRSATETNTVPDSGMPPYAASWLFANARGKSRSMPMTSPVERISGPSTESTRLPVLGAEALERQHGLLHGDRRVQRHARAVDARAAGPRPSSSAIVAPTMMRAAAFASGMPSAFDTNGTVRLARGFASST